MEYYVNARFRGWRFDNGAIPLSLLSNLALWESVAYELAKECYHQDYPEQQIPYRFKESTRMSLIGIRQGSAVAMMVSRPTLMFGEVPYIEKAFNLLMSNIRNNTLDIPTTVKRYLVRLRQGLTPNESIEVTTSSDSAPVALTYGLELQLKNLLKYNKAEMALADLGGRTAVTVFSTRISSSLHEEENSATIEKPWHANTAESSHVPTRLDDFHEIQNGWLLDETSVAPLRVGLDWLADSWMKYYSPELPSPYIFPTPEGGIDMEWKIENRRAILEVDLKAHYASWLQWDKITNEERSQSLDLNSITAWEYITSKVRALVADH